MIKIGSIFENRYLILAELGEGGMGKVYKAKQLDVDRLVALKFLKDSHDGTSNERFFREFKVLSELKHQHIMTVYGLSLYSQDKPYAICELLEGKSLRGLLLERGSLPWEEAADIALQISEALEYAHSRGVIHRDLKPENIVLVDKPHENCVKVIDFGLTKVMNEDMQKLTATGQMLGSPQYMSPELTTRSADHRSDIYSLGCIIFEMLAGELLFPTDQAVAAIYKHSNESATERIQAIKTDVPEKLIQLVLEMLAKDPNERIQSANEVAQRLRLLIETPGRNLPRESNSDRRHSAMLIAVACTILISLLGLLLVSFVKLKSARHSSANVGRIQNSTKSFSKQLTDLAAEERNSHIAAVEYIHVTGKEQDHAKKKADELIRKLKALEPYARTPKEQYALYFLESKCFNTLKDFKSNLIALEKCLDICRKDKSRKYAEEPGLLSIIAGIYSWNLKQSDKAIAYSYETLELQKKYAQWISTGHELDTIDKEVDALNWQSESVHEILAWQYMNKTNYEQAAFHAKILADHEAASLPNIKYPGDVSLSHVLVYAEALRMLGRQAEGVRYLEAALARLNKIGEIPESRSRSNQRAAVACSVLKMYQDAIRWFKDRGHLQQAETYAKVSREYADHYHLKYDPYSNDPPYDPNAKPYPE